MNKRWQKDICGRLLGWQLSGGSLWPHLARTLPLLLPLRSAPKPLDVALIHFSTRFDNHFW